MTCNANPPRNDLSKEVIESLKARGYNQSDIAKMYNVSRQAVSWHLRTYGGTLSARQIVGQAWPWATGQGHTKAGAYRRLRDHGEFMRTGGAGMDSDKLKRLKVWWKMMHDEDLVVEFDPNIPPRKGQAAHGGFAYRSRVPGDRDLLIRVNEYTNLTDDGEVTWCWPANIDELI